MEKMESKRISAKEAREIKRAVTLKREMELRKSVEDYLDKVIFPAIGSAAKNEEDCVYIKCSYQSKFFDILEGILEGPEYEYDVTYNQDKHELSIYW